MTHSCIMHIITHNYYLMYFADSQDFTSYPFLACEFQLELKLPIVAELHIVMLILLGSLKSKNSENTDNFSVSIMCLQQQYRTCPYRTECRTQRTYVVVSISQKAQIKL